MPQIIRSSALVLTLLAVLGFMLSWKFFLSPDRLTASPLYQKTLDATADNVATPPANPDESLRIYSVNVVHTPPFKDPFFGYGVYLGQGLILTAAHVLGAQPSYSKPHVIIAGRDLPARIIRQGSLEETDLALLSVDRDQLPIGLQLRRITLCKGPLQVGTGVIVAYPERIVRSQVISALLIAPQSRSKFGTLIGEPQGSGSGVFDAQRKCLMGIMTRQVMKYSYQNQGPFRIAKPSGWAGYFVPASTIASFTSAQHRF
jgi:hypothetical protein